MDLKSQQDVDYFESLKKDQERIQQFYKEAFKVPEVKPEVKPEVLPEVKLTTLEMRQARINYFKN
jgi:hypothetical protein